MDKGKEVALGREYIEKLIKDSIKISAKNLFLQKERKRLSDRLKKVEKELQETKQDTQGAVEMAKNIDSIIEKTRNCLLTLQQAVVMILDEASRGRISPKEKKALDEFKEVILAAKPVSAEAEEKTLIGFKYRFEK